MRGTPPSRLIVLALGALVLLRPVIARSAPTDEPYFFDDFDGSSIDASKWDTTIATTGVRYIDGVWTVPPAQANYGAATVQNSGLTLANDAPTLACPIFPLLWTNNAIPATGDFELEFRMRYAAGGNWGDGVRVVTMPAPFDPAPGSTTSAKGDYVLMIHQDNVDCKGPNVSVQGHPGVDGSALPFDTDWHTYTLDYIGGQSTVLIDGAYFAGPLPTSRPNCIQLGVGEDECCGEGCDIHGCWWTSYTLDYLKVTALSVVPTRSTTLGQLKNRYR